MEPQKFKGVWLPKEICDLENLSWIEKIILAEISSLSSEKGCYANNMHFAQLLKLRKEGISRIISRLVKAGLPNFKHKI